MLNLGFEKLKILLSLYKVREGTLKDISEKAGYKYTSGTFYRLKNWLINEEIIEKVKEVDDTAGRGSKKTEFFRVRHDVIDSILLAEEDTKVLFDRSMRLVLKPKPRKSKVF